MADGSIMENVSSLTLVTNDGTTDHIAVAALNDTVKYLKIESSASGLGGYSIGRIA